MIACLICNKNLHSINGGHLRYVHKMVEAEYAEMFPGAPFQSDELKQKKSEKEN